MGCALSRRGDPHWERLSLWHDTVDTDWTPRPALSGDIDADVAIVGAGFTGLWTAYYLAEADPTLRIVVLEAETAGFGASGRNGGWCSALFPASLGTLAGLGDRDGALAQHRAMRETVDEVLRVAAAEGIDADIAKGGTIALARSRAQLRRARAEVAEARDVGPRRGRPAAAGRCRRPRSCAAPAPSARRTPPTARRSTPRGWCAGSPMRSSVAASRSTSAARSARSSPAARTPRTATSGPRTVIRATEGYTPSLRGQEPDADPGLLPDHRHRAAARPRSGTRSGWPGARRSPTTGT